MRRLSAVAALAALLLAACSPDAGDFKEEAEKYIEGRDFSEQAGLLRYTEVECEEPESTERDTRYVCTAIAEDGSAWQFEVEITGKSDLEVLIPPTPLSDSAGSSLPGDSTQDTANAPSTTGPAGATTTRPDDR